MSDSSRAVRCIGAGISGGGTDAVLVQWLYSHEDAEPVQLRAVGVFRGAPGWSRPVSSDAEHARELRGAGTRIGYELAHTTLWLEVDPLNATVIVGDTVVPWLPPDAIHAFTIDRIVHVGILLETARKLHHLPLPTDGNTDVLHPDLLRAAPRGDPGSTAPLATPNLTSPSLGSQALLCRTNVNPRTRAARR